MLTFYLTAKRVHILHFWVAPNVDKIPEYVYVHVLTMLTATTIL